ncbi:hypothetical protein ACFZAR_00845 [Streptomyces sp. NPDC008222]|uniref:hypothetical protein n=1 Tax=Streptomyces sp. NPDC008222 TaxID=3364820 RepID=UPI0036EC156B
MISTSTATARLRARLAAGAVMAAALGLVSCAASDGHEAAASGAASPSASRAAAGAAEQKLGAQQFDEKQLGEQAEAMLGGFGSGGAMVEAGTERVAEGIHTEPSLGRGRAYRLDLVCIGRGSARAVFTPAGTGTETGVPCDRSVVRRRITPHGPVRIDVDGVKGSTGVVAWVVREVGRAS